MKELRKKLLDPNSTVVYYTLQVLDSIMKNCASDVHKEILSHEFMGIIKSVVTSSRVREGGRERERERERVLVEVVQHPLPCLQHTLLYPPYSSHSLAPPSEHPLISPPPSSGWTQ